MKRLILVAALALGAGAVISAEPASGMLCNTSVMVAHKAYVEGTFDAKNPDIEQLHYMVDYWADNVDVLSDRETAKDAVEFIAERMRRTGSRIPDEGVAYQFARDFMVYRCN